MGEKLADEFKFPVKCRYKDLDGDWVEAAILCSNCGTVSLKVSKRFKPLSKEKQLYLNALPVSVAVIDAEGAIVFMNPTAQLLVDQEPHEYMRRKFVKCISSDLNTTILGEHQSISTFAGKKLKALVANDVVEFN